jgi:hypothetical protein
LKKYRIDGVDESTLLGFPMNGMAGAARAVFLEFEPLRSLILSLWRGVVPLGAFRASQNYFFFFLFCGHDLNALL